VNQFINTIVAIQGERDSFVIVFFSLSFVLTINLKKIKKRQSRVDRWRERPNWASFSFPFDTSKNKNPPLGGHHHLDASKS
jgi:hypothetical protein